MTADDKVLPEFRSQVSRFLQKREREWDASRRLLETTRFGSTLHRLFEAANRATLPPLIRDTIAAALKHGEAHRIQDLPGPTLKELTGLPPSKALRALCVWFNLVEIPSSCWPAPTLDAEAIEQFLRHHDNPFDLLLTSEVASVLDLGAGDLSFASELADRYVPMVQERGRTLILHAVDRLRPQSKLGGPLHPDQERLQRLRTRPGLSFQFFGDQDMCCLETLDQDDRLAHCYTISTCWAPATPTFAYEPTRLSPDIIQTELRRTRGAYHCTHYAGEAALEVQHGDRALLFPPWKFDIRGPLALLNVIARRGRLCVLGAIDNQVFWELLSQLLEDDRYRPVDRIFTPESIPEVFGGIYQILAAVPIGGTIDLSTYTTLRSQIPSVLSGQSQQSLSHAFRTVHIRRGATFPQMPASSTARQFRDMVEEVPPWMLILVPHP